MPRIQAVSLDVGGVLVVPDHGVLSATLQRHGIDHDRPRFGIGHYLAMAAVDRAASDAEDFTDYLWGFVRAVGVPEDRATEAHQRLDDVLMTPVWCQPVPGSRVGVRALAAAGLRMAVTSNSDGQVADLLRRHEIAQVGEGPGCEVEVVTDSGVLGVAKPHPRMFTATAEALGLPPAQVLHVGDSAFYDVEGAAAVGMPSVHVDPYGICDSLSHPHIRELSDVLALAGVAP